jgi:hypothetical protein
LVKFGEKAEIGTIKHCPNWKTMFYTKMLKAENNFIKK